MKKGDLYIVSSANWSVAQMANSADEAATKAFERMISLKGGSLQVSPIVEVTNFSQIKQQTLVDDFVTLMYSPKVMADAGYHSTAKEFTKLIDELPNSETYE